MAVRKGKANGRTCGRVEEGPPRRYTRLTWFHIPHEYVLLRRHPRDVATLRIDREGHSLVQVMLHLADFGDESIPYVLHVDVVQDAECSCNEAAKISPLCVPGPNLSLRTEVDWPGAFQGLDLRSRLWVMPFLPHVSRTVRLRLSYKACR